MKMIRENKSDFCRCVCKQRSKKAGEVKPRCAEDLAAVSLLPDQWIPQRSGPTLINYLKEREDNYKATLCSMSEDTAVVNNDIGMKIREFAETLYTHFKDYHHIIECIINDYTIAKDKSHEACDLALEEVAKIYDEGIQDIDQFKNNILHLEHLRSDGLKCIFESKFNKLVSVEHYTPNNILPDFDEHVCRLNDQLLTNLKAYFELVGQLQTHLDEIVAYARSVINKLCLTPNNTCADSADIIDGDKLLDNKEGADLDLKKIVTCLIDACQGTISKLCTELFNYLDDLEKNIYIINFDVKSLVLSDLENISNNGLQRILDCCTQYDTLEHDEPIRKSIDYMIKSLSDFKESLLSSYSVLYDAGHLISAPVVRLALAQKLTLVQLEEIQTNNDLIELANEIGFNIALEQMCGAPDVEKVQNQYDLLTNLLQKQDNLYYQHSVHEVNKLKDFLNLLWNIIDMLDLECSCYLNAKSNILYSSNENITFTSHLDFITQSSIRIQEFLPRTILLSQDRNTSLSNWKNKFLSSLDAIKLSLRDILDKQGHKWMEEKCLILNMRYSLKTMSHAVRKERVIAARDARIKEIRLHESVLKSHLDTLNRLIETLPTEASNFIDFDSKELYPLNYWATQIQNKIALLLGQSGNSIDELFQIDPELKRMKLASYGLRLRKCRRLFEESLDSAANFYKRNVELRIHSARISNFKFMEQIKLFNECGSYAAAEAIKTNAVLVKTADALESCMSGTMDAVNRCQTHLMKLADELILPMMQLENVQLLDKYNLRNPSKGTLYFATTHLIFVDHEMRKETWILLMHISSVERMPITTTGSPLLVRTKTFQSVFFVIPRERDCYEMHQTLLRLSQPVHLDELYCFHYKSTPDDLPKSAGWNFFDIQTEYQRMNVPNEHWVLCTANKDYELCDTYPSQIYVPARASTAVLLGSASFRSRGRLPVLAYLHHNKAAIARCSQPLSGFSARCMEDEQMLDLIRRANPNCGYMYVVDTRPRINAMVNRAAGKGYENEAFYENIKFQFMGIGNIHVMRKSLQKLVETCEQNSPTISSFLSGLESSGWLKHIKSILDTSWWIACAVQSGVSVCVHCSDGWDRTAQACSLAALLLEPHYRTINGYQALIEKDWLSFGHKFTARCAHVAGDGRERSPVFTQLLDCTWQLLRQLPEAFQFNERFLLTLHDHAHACQYGTFVGNCEKDRRDLRLSERTFSLWGYMASHLNEYKNPLYNPKAHTDMIKPDLSAHSIRFWRGMYCRHESGVHPREALADLLPAAVDHATALTHHIDYLAKRITTFKSLLSGRKAKKDGAVNYQNGNTNTVTIETKAQALSIDNKLLYESAGTISELECANHDHPLKDTDPPPKPARIPLITEKTDASIPPTLAELEAEINTVALDWKSIKNVTECSCSTPLDHFSRKHHCWGCGRCVCTRCVCRRPLPALAASRAVPLCAACAPSAPASPATPPTPAISATPAESADLVTSTN